MTINTSSNKDEAKICPRQRRVEEQFCGNLWAFIYNVNVRIEIRVTILCIH